MHNSGLGSISLRLCSEGIRAQEKKVAAIKQLQPPRSIKKICSFLEMTGYYHICIPQCAQVAVPPVRLTRKYQRFEWGDEQQITFEEMLCSNQVMAYPNVQKPYKLCTDSCDY